MKGSVTERGTKRQSTKVVRKDSGPDDKCLECVQKNEGWCLGRVSRKKWRDYLRRIPPRYSRCTANVGEMRDVVLRGPAVARYQPVDAVRAAHARQGPIRVVISAVVRH